MLHEAVEACKVSSRLSLRFKESRAPNISMFLFPSTPGITAALTGLSRLALLMHKLLYDLETRHSLLMLPEGFNLAGVFRVQLSDWALHMTPHWILLSFNILPYNLVVIGSMFYTQIHNLRVIHITDTILII